MTTTQKVKIISSRGKTAEGEVQIQTWTKASRTRRAAKFWVICWLLVLPAVCVPIAHFILVPGLLIAGPTGFWYLSRQSSVVTGGSSICPECGAALPIARGPESWPLSDLCTGCQTAVSIEKLT